jgi:hypothetical protein
MINKNTIKTEKLSIIQLLKAIEKDPGPLIKMAVYITLIKKLKSL